MLRAVRVIASKVPKKTVGGIRHSSHGGGSTGISATSAAVGLAAVGGVAYIGGVLGYAAWSEENRKAVDDKVPGFQYITDLFLGSAKQSSVIVPAQFVPPKPKFIETNALLAPSKASSSEEPKQDDFESRMKNMERDNKISDSEAPIQNSSTVHGSSGTTLDASFHSAAESSTGSNHETGYSLPELLKTANAGVTAALSAAEAAAHAVHSHTSALIDALESGQVDSNIKEKVAKIITDADDVFKQAQLRVSELTTGITCTRNSGIEDSNLAAAEETVSDLTSVVSRIKTILTESYDTMLNIEMLCTTLSDAKFKLSSELQNAIPNLSSLDVENQLKLLLSFASNKIAALQQKLQEQQKAGTDYALRSDGHVQDELDKLRHMLTLQHRSDLGRQREELEAEVRGQLKRQASAHTELLHDELEKLKKQLTSTWQLKLYDELNKCKDKHFKDIASVKGKLLGLQGAVNARADADRDARSARQLWLSCQALRDALRLGREDASSWDEQLQPLRSHINAISAAAGEDVFVSALLSSVNPVAADRGVYTNEALRHRFLKVDTVARRVAMIPENGASLLRYLLSYVQSVLLVQASNVPSHEQLLDSPVNIHELTIFDILDRARVCLLADDMIGCVRWLNQLTGESRRVAQDWKQEARLALEMRQLADALTTYATATTATSV